MDRSGGRGYLIGYEPSPHHVGKTAVQRALHARDLELPLALLHQAIVDHFGRVRVGEGVGMHLPIPTNHAALHVLNR